MRNRQKLLDKVFNFTHGYRDRLAIVSGPPGSGKSWLLEQLGQRLHEQPHRLVRASSSDSVWPLSGLLSFLATVPLKLSPELSAHFPRTRDAAVDCFHVAMTLHHELLDRIAPGTVFLIDDLDFMDADSQQVLGFLATRLQGNRISFIATIGSTEVPEHFGAFKVFRLGVADNETIRRVAQENVIGEFDDAVVEILTQLAQPFHRLSEGR